MTPYFRDCETVCQGKNDRRSKVLGLEVQGSRRRRTAGVKAASLIIILSGKSFIIFACFVSQAFLTRIRRRLRTKKEINHENTKGRKHEKRQVKFRAFKISCFRDENIFS